MSHVARSTCPLRGTVIFVKANAVNSKIGAKARWWLVVQNNFLQKANHVMAVPFINANPKVRRSDMLKVFTVAEECGQPCDCYINCAKVCVIDTDDIRVKIQSAPKHIMKAVRPRLRFTLGVQTPEETQALLNIGRRR